MASAGGSHMSRKGRWVPKCIRTGSLKNSRETIGYLISMTWVKSVPVQISAILLYQSSHHASPDPPIIRVESKAEQLT